MRIEVENLCFSYERTHVLHNVNLQVQSGEFIGIMGPNGGGKTTLFKLLMGFITPTAGKVRVQGKIGYVPQVPKTDRDFPITVQELILLGALSQTTFWGAYPTQIKEKAAHLMEKLGLYAHRQKVFGALSGGLAQRALLARALLSDPDLLLLDEPTANIDPASIQIFFHMLEELKGKKTILLVTHDLRTIIERVGRVLCVQGSVSSFLPKEVCEHFALGLYHTPLMEEKVHVGFP
ncbi:MAG: ATP-binding cassette domain-containing protein [Verrucomicrobia bacterium]|nr:ATP-binding cassette domain-containing protein [Verrucomicrobiota bacterium]MDE3047285.1 ATP-binding cassette domain-containing protein [Verrucomicrobiota bacterium]